MFGNDYVKLFDYLASDAEFYDYLLDNDFHMYYFNQTDAMVFNNVSLFDN